MFLRSKWIFGGLSLLALVVLLVNVKPAWALTVTPASPIQGEPFTISGTIPPPFDPNNTYVDLYIFNGSSCGSANSAVLSALNPDISQSTYTFHEPGLISEEPTLWAGLYSLYVTFVSSSAVPSNEITEYDLPTCLAFSVLPAGQTPVPSVSGENSASIGYSCSVPSQANPVAAIPGAGCTVFGSGWTPSTDGGQNVAVNFGALNIPSLTITYVSDEGRFQGGFTIPLDATPGTYTMTATQDSITASQDIVVPNQGSSGGTSDVGGIIGIGILVTVIAGGGIGAYAIKNKTKKPQQKFVAPLPEAVQSATTLQEPITVELPPPPPRVPVETKVPSFIPYQGPTPPTETSQEPGQEPAKQPTGCPDDHLSLLNQYQSYPDTVDSIKDEFMTQLNYRLTDINYCDFGRTQSALNSNFLLETCKQDFLELNEAKEQLSLVGTGLHMGMSHVILELLGAPEAVGLIALAAEIGEAAWNNVPPEEWKVKSLMDKLNNDIKKLDDSVKQYRDFTKQRDDAVNGINKLVNSYNTRLETLYSEHYRDFENLSVGHYLSVAPPVPLGPTLDTPGAKGSPPHVDNPVLPPDPLAGQPQPRTYQEEEEAAKEFWSAAFTGLAGPH
jgi:hypothetical protein